MREGLGGDKSALLLLTTTMVLNCYSEVIAPLETNNAAGVIKMKLVCVRRVRRVSRRGHRQSACLGTTRSKGAARMGLGDRSKTSCVQPRILTIHDKFFRSAPPRI